MYFCRGWLSLDPLPFSDRAEYNGNSKKYLMVQLKAIGNDNISEKEFSIFLSPVLQI